MMVPPLTEHLLKRSVGKRPDNRNIYFLYEGKVTEKEFIEGIINRTDFFTNKEINLKEFFKTGNDQGVTQVEGLVSLAKNFIKDSQFKNGFDKIVIVFDLDVKNNDQEEINKILDLIQPANGDIILAYTNPAIELFLLMTKPTVYTTLIDHQSELILKNDWVGAPPNERRYVHNLLETTINVSAKKTNGGVNCLSDGINNAITQEKYINHYLDDAAGKLTSNIGYILEKINNNDFDIQYKKNI